MNELLMSVVTVSPEGLEPVRRTLARLARQTIARGLEVIVVMLRAAEEWTPGESVFRSARTIAGQPGWSTGEALAAAVEAASAPVFAYAEEHTYPDPEWAEALVRAHAGPWSVVGARLVNANPGTATSWASFLSGFAMFTRPGAGREMSSAPTHNSSYKTAALQGYKPLLPRFLNAESLLHARMRADGHRLYYEPAAITQHLNISVERSYRRAWLLAGQTWGALRAQQENWSPWRRVTYVGAGPLIPGVRVRKALGAMRDNGWQELISYVLPSLVAAEVAATIGEVQGYALGAGTAPADRSEYELWRSRHVSVDDLRALQAQMLDVARGYGG